MLIVLILSSIFCLYLWYLLNHRRLLKMTAAIPTLPGEVPVLGHALKIIGDSSSLFNEITKMSVATNEVGGISKIWLGPKLIILVTDPVFARSFVNAHLHKIDIYKIASSWLGQGLIIADVPIWKRHRKLLNPTFKQQILNGFVSLFNKNSVRLVENLRQHIRKGPVDATAEVTQAAMETNLQAVIGLTDEEILSMAKGFMKAINEIDHLYTARFQSVLLMSNIIYNWSDYKKQEDRLVKYFNDYTKDILKKKKLTRLSRTNDGETDNRTKSFIDLLLELQEAGELTDQQIKDEVNSMLAAATDSISLSMVYILVVLGSYPEVQQNVYNELKEVFPNPKDGLTKDTLMKMSYTDAVVKEILRLYPVVPIIGRHVVEDVKFEKFTIPAGTDVTFTLWGMDRHRSWVDPETFRPERWLDPNMAPELYTFSVGRRNCIGKPYALLLLKSFVAHIISHYRLEADCSQLKMSLAINTKPTSGHMISFEERY